MEDNTFLYQMKLKKILFRFIVFLALIPISNEIEGQDKRFRHSLGASFQSLNTQPLRYLYISNTQPPFYRKHQSEKRYYGTLSYHLSSRVWAMDSTALDLSLDLPTELSLFWSTDETSVSNYVNLSLPLLLSVNYGAYSFGQESSKSKLGLFGGGGVFWQYTDGNLGFRNNFSPYIQAGLRFDFGKRFGLEVAYGQNLFFSEIQREEAGDPWFTPEFFLFRDIQLQSRTYSIRLIF